MVVVLGLEGWFIGYMLLANFLIGTGDEEIVIARLIGSKRPGWFYIISNMIRKADLYVDHGNVGTSYVDD